MATSNWRSPERTDHLVTKARSTSSTLRRENSSPLVINGLPSFRSKLGRLVGYIAANVFDALDRQMYFNNMPQMIQFNLTGYKLHGFTS